MIGRLGRTIATDNQAVTVVLDFVNPVGPDRRLAGAGRNAGLDEAVGAQPVRLRRRLRTRRKLQGIGDALATFLRLLWLLLLGVTPLRHAAGIDLIKGSERDSRIIAAIAHYLTVYRAFDRDWPRTFWRALPKRDRFLSGWLESLGEAERNSRKRA